MRDENSPLFIIIRGIPGSGKTDLAEYVQTKWDTSNLVVLDPDYVNQTDPDFLSYRSDQLATDEIYKKESFENDPQLIDKLVVSRYLLNQAKEAISTGKSVIWNQPWSIKYNILWTINEIQLSASEQARVHPIIVELVIRESVARKRVESRKTRGGHGPSERTFLGMAQKHEEIGVMDFPILKLSSEDPTEKIGNLLLKYLDDLTLSQ